MTARLSATGTSKRGEARDFASGFNLARKNMDDLQALKERLDAAAPAEKPPLEREMRELLDEAARRLKHVLMTAEAKTPRAPGR